MSEPAAEYRVWRPEPTNTVPGPVYEPPPLDERRDRVRAGFDAAFVDALAVRLGTDASGLLDRIGAPGAIDRDDSNSVGGTLEVRGQVSKKKRVKYYRLDLPHHAGRVARGSGSSRIGSGGGVESDVRATIVSTYGPVLSFTSKGLFDALAFRGRRLRLPVRHVTIVPSSGSPRTASGTRGIRVTGSAADALYDCYLLAERAEAVLGSADSVPVWFGLEIGALGDTRPFGWLDTAAGRERVAEVLDAIAYGFPG